MFNAPQCPKTCSPSTTMAIIATEGFDVPEGMEQLARRGAKACPERIILVEEDDGTISWPPGAAA
ncbi:MAG TPA: ferredoxin [Sphingobium sp.]|uniref:ferredoxin n=1 Tax=Sphingobium sp. TaxID=1912891 RepID=UPI002ED25BD8